MDTINLAALEKSDAPAHAELVRAVGSTVAIVGGEIRYAEGAPEDLHDWARAMLPKLAGKDGVFRLVSEAEEPQRNPWLPEFFNLTRQAEIQRSDPSRAVKLREQAKKLKG